jgi:hypothetical protein
VSVIAPLPLIDAPDAGVIEDARERQRRRHQAGYAATLVVLLAGLLAYSASRGGAAIGTTTPAPPASGAVTSVSLHPPKLGLAASPSLTAGAAGLCVSAAGFREYGNCQTPTPYPQTGIPLEPADGGFPLTSSNPKSHATARGRIYLLLAAPDVAAVRVGDLGTIPVQDAPGLPPGDRAVAFRVPSADTRTVLAPGQLSQDTQQPHTSGAITLTALDKSGGPIKFAGATVLNRLWLPLWPHKSWPAGEFANWPSGVCAVTNSNQLVPFNGMAVTAMGVVAQPAAAPSAFLSCLNQVYVVGHNELEVTVLLNAREPSRPAAPLWGARRLPGHPRIVAVKGPSSSSLPGPTVARRSRNAWLVVGPYSGCPTLKQSLKVLSSLHVTRLDTSQA